MEKQPNSEIVTILAKNLCDFEILKSRALGFHWNVEGSNFLDYHEHFEELYNAFHDYADMLAERIRQYESFPPTMLAEFLEGTRHEENGSGQIRDAKEMLSRMLNDLSFQSKWISEDSKLVGEKQDLVTQDILIEINRALDKKIWFLKSLVK